MQLYFFVLWPQKFISLNESLTLHREMASFIHCCLKTFSFELHVIDYSRQNFAWIPGVSPTNCFWTCPWFIGPEFLTDNVTFYYYYHFLWGEANNHPPPLRGEMGPSLPIYLGMCFVFKEIRDIFWANGMQSSSYI